MDEHGFSGADAWVASERKGPGGVQRRKIARKDMAGRFQFKRLWLAASHSRTYPTRADTFYRRSFLWHTPHHAVGTRLGQYSNVHSYSTQVSTKEV